MCLGYRIIFGQVFMRAYLPGNTRVLRELTFKQRRLYFVQTMEIKGFV